MRKSKIIQFPNIGPVLFEHSQRAKNINISVKPPSLVRVAIPRDVSFNKAANFVITKKIWIINALRKVSLSFEKRKKLKPINKEYAKEYLVKRLEELAIKNGFIYNKVAIRNQKTRWGSCSKNNNISLNMQLMNLPVELIDYVILHELVHTKVKNHSKFFWNTLENYIFNAREKNRALKKYII